MRLQSLAQARCGELDESLRGSPQAEMHCLDSGHFALEDSLDVIAERMIAFHQKKVQ